MQFLLLQLEKIELSKEIECDHYKLKTVKQMDNNNMTVAIQGSTTIETNKDLKQHISKLSNSQNFGLLLGAGASKCLKGKLMTEVWDEFRNQNDDAINWLIKEKFLSDCGKKMRINGGSEISLEMLVDHLSIAIEYEKRLEDEKLIKTVEVKEKLMTSIISAGLLSRKLWEYPKKRDKSSILNHHIEVLEKIRHICQERPGPWVFTTNYDLAVEWAAKSINFQVNAGYLNQSNRLLRPYMFDSNGYTDTLNLVKLHGSYSWEKNGDEIIDLTENKLKLKMEKIVAGKSSVAELLILPGSSKYVKSTEFLYAELLRQFANFLAMDDTVLFIVGYSFGDEHINQQIASALVFKENLKVVIYFPSLESVDGICELPPELRTIFKEGKSKVTIVGGGKEAHFKAFADHLPKGIQANSSD